MRQATRRGALWLAGLTLAALHIAALGADFFAPYHYAIQDRAHPYAPPHRLHFIDAQGKLHWRPFVYPWTSDSHPLDGYREDRTTRLFLRWGVEPTAEVGRQENTYSTRLFGVEPPIRVALLGTDRFGRDQLSRLLYGARISLFSGLLAALGAVGLGLFLGTLAGLRGGWTDRLLMRGAELFMSLPWLYLLIAWRAFLPLEATPQQTFFSIVGIIALVGWARPARLIRSAVLSLKERTFVKSARGFGATDGYLLRHHLLPQVSSLALTQVALLIPRFILAEATLSFLGLGMAEPVPSLGNLLAELQHLPVLLSHTWMLWPAAFLVVVVVSYHHLTSVLQKRLGVMAV